MSTRPARTSSLPSTCSRPAQKYGEFLGLQIRTRNFWLLGQQRLVPIFDLLDHREDPNTEYTGKWETCALQHHMYGGHVDGWGGWW